MSMLSESYRDLMSVSCLDARGEASKARASEGCALHPPRALPLESVHWVRGQAFLVSPDDLDCGLKGDPSRHVQ
jgi:hypothetical protein